MPSTPVSGFVVELRHGMKRLLAGRVGRKSFAVKSPAKYPAAPRPPPTTMYSYLSSRFFKNEIARAGSAYAPLAGRKALTVSQSPFIRGSEVFEPPPPFRTARVGPSRAISPADAV